MTRISDKNVMLGADEGEGNAVSAATYESQLIALEDRLRELETNNAADNEKAKVLIHIARVKLALQENQEAWNMARELFDIFLANQEWEYAVDACDVMFLSEQDGSLSALGQGVWLAVTYPIDPELTVGMLQHIVDETPDDSDGAAVAAATAIYIADLRAEGKQKDSLLFFSNQILGAVARRHSECESQQQFEFWIKKMELDDPDKFLVRLRNVIDVLVQDDWWFDRDELRNQLPVN